MEVPCYSNIYFERSSGIKAPGEVLFQIEKVKDRKNRKKMPYIMVLGVDQHVLSGNRPESDISSGKRYIPLV